MEKQINLCLKLTNAAVNQIEQYLDIKRQYNSSSRDEDIVKQIFGTEYFNYYLQNATRDMDKEIRVRLLMASDTENTNNSKFIDKHKNRILILEGINTTNREFLIIKVRLLPRKVGTDSNKSLKAQIKFSAITSISSSAIPEEMIQQIAQLPNAQELYRKIDKNINDWDNYLAIIEEHALNSQIEIHYEGFKQQEVFTHCTFCFANFTTQDIEKMKTFRNERVILIGRRKVVINSEPNEEDECNINKQEIFEDIEERIGNIEQINFKTHTIKVELEPEFQELATEGALNFPMNGYLRISKMGDLMQARNLRKGLNALKFGESYNPDLDVILFNSKALVDNIENTIKLQEEQLLLPSLNRKQKEAVEGVLNAKDIFLIQGPPGTGKTTVIAEICYQNAIRGMKTLIASQSNLAVDNALSRLIHNPSIRALRQGNFSRVEDEGKKYTEDQVVDTWLTKTAESCVAEYTTKYKQLEEIICLEDQVEDISKQYKEKICLEKNIQQTNIQYCTFLKQLEELKRHYGIARIDVENMEHYIWYLKKLEGYKDENKMILETMDRVYESYSKISEVAVSTNDLKFIIYKIKKVLNENQKYQDIQSGLEKQIQQLTYLKKAIFQIPVSKIMLQVEKDILVDKQKILEQLSSIQHSQHYKYEINDQIQEIGSLINEIRYIYELLEKLKSNYRIKDIEVEKTTKDLRIDEEEIKEFKTNCIQLYNFKPMKLLVWIGAKKQWQIDVITQLNRTNAYLKQLEGKIEQLKTEIERACLKVNQKSDAFLCLVDQLQASFILKFEENNLCINNNIETICLLKTDFSRIKTLFYAWQDKNELVLKLQLHMYMKKLTSQKRRIDEIIKSLEKYNEQIKTRFNTSVTVTQVEQLLDIDTFYKCIISSSKEPLAYYVEIVGEWIKRIKQKKYGNREELQKLYINTANVIGITCVQSGNKNFTESYPNFDVVIVDEVSKATPPELILPLLKGKKIVLVGDHKQLPPMIGSETFEELKTLTSKEEEESDIAQLEYMKTSLFEEIFNNISSKNKVMLDTQYRMHSSIMNVINQFYIEKNSKGLVCGIENEEECKKHNLNLPYLKENQHILWVDIPLHANYYEQKNRYNSCYNNVEVQVIDKILKDIHEHCMQTQRKQEVAVITFYSAQAKELQKQFVAKNKYPWLKIRVGTVDRFQGMEREVVIVSFVRNNNEGKIGFAKDPKRINVALSRAQNLLIIVGCSELFCEKNGKVLAKENYKNVLRIVNDYEGLIDAQEVFY